MAELCVNPSEFLRLSAFECFDDESGYRATLAIAAGEFACAGRPFFFDHLNEFIQTLRAAHAALAGTAELRQQFETQECLRFTFANRGAVIVSGAVIAYGSLERSLRFAFEADQTFVPPFLAQLDQIAAEFEA